MIDKSEIFDYNNNQVSRYGNLVNGALAQLGARHTGSVEVTGSNPVCSIFFIPETKQND